MGEYLLSPEQRILRNLMLHPPVEGSRESHEAWKENVNLLLNTATKAIWLELDKPGFISATFRNECIRFGKALPTENRC